MLYFIILREAFAVTPLSAASRVSFIAKIMQSCPGHSSPVISLAAQIRIPERVSEF
jgi:hypothetical protein